MPRLSIPITTSYVPVRVTGDATLFRNATFFGYKNFNVSGVPVNNGAIVYFGINSGECAMQIAAGSSSAYTIYTTQERDNLSNYFVQGASGDGVYVIYN